MKFIIGFLTIGNLILWIAFDVMCWFLTGTTLGWIGLITLIAFIIALGLSGEATLSVRDYFRDTAWELFLTKIKWANSTAIIVMGLVAMLFLMLDWCGLRGFLGMGF